MVSITLHGLIRVQPQIRKFFILLMKEVNLMKYAYYGRKPWGVL